MNSQFAAGVAVFGDLAEELGGVAVPVVPPLVQVFDVRVDEMGALLGLGDQLVDGGGVGELADGGGVQIELTSDRGLGPALADQVPNRGVVLAHPADDLLLR
ncbi:hypothetical protein [Actinokineospora sp. HUAS TT18]|uniref:hypothetical protein n=1 Tax=Actinokineospora sp. HUAS TT18 TaxID=3447451 RepID=UPI003F520A23